jgi:hypothetical protein
MDTPPEPVSPEADADTWAIIEHVMTGKPLDPEVYRRVRARGEQVTEELRRRYGTVEIAVDLIREAREEE